MKKQNRESHRDVHVTNILATILLMLVIITCIPLTVPRMFGYQVYNVISGSMEPAIPTGSLVYVKSIEPDTVETDDVIAFYSTDDLGAITTHRVVENHLVSGEFITKGDANADKDPMPVDYNNLLGKVSYSIPVLGELLAMVATTTGKIVIGAVIAVAIILFLIDK